MIVTCMACLIFGGRHYYPEADPDDWVFIPAGRESLSAHFFGSASMCFQSKQRGMFGLNV